MQQPSPKEPRKRLPGIRSPGGDMQIEGMPKYELPSPVFFHKIFSKMEFSAGARNGGKIWIENPVTVIISVIIKKDDMIDYCIPVTVIKSVYRKEG